MKQVTKIEKEAILRTFPKAHIRRTMSGKSNRHRYYCEESDKISKFLEEFRSNSLVAKKEV